MMRNTIYIMIFLSACCVQGQAVYNGSNKHTFTTNYGNIEIGPLNSNWGHIYTDRPKIIFNKDVYTTSNAFSSYNNDLIFKTEGNERMRINDDTGNVGIGSTDPGAKLDIRGNGVLLAESSSLTNGDVRIFNHTGTTYGFMIRPYDISFNGGNWNWYQDFGYREDTKNWYVETSFGIGVSDPGTYKLAVNGNIRAKEIKVETGWADYVFKDDYLLPTLQEVEQHIKEKGHLINIPSAQEVAQNGIQLGEMNKLLLEKIEELTLYILQQEERIQALETLKK